MQQLTNPSPSHLTFPILESRGKEIHKAFGKSNAPFIVLNAHIGTDDNEFIVVKSQRLEAVYSRVKHTCVNTPIK